MGNCAFNARTLQVDNADRHEARRRRLAEEDALASMGELEGVGTSFVFSGTMLPNSSVVAQSQWFQFGGTILHGVKKALVGTGRKTELSPSPASSLYTSSRIQSMLERRSKFRDKTAFAIEASKVHWSELDPPLDSDDQQSPESDRLYFDEVLRKHPVWGGSRFFQDFEDLEIGDKIAEGGQGEVYEAGRTRYGGWYAVKVFKKGFPLRLLLQQMPASMLSAVKYDSVGGPMEFIYGGTMLKEGRLKNRFALLMEYQSCDLRNFIDDQMLSKNNRGPPFTMGITTKILLKIVQDMVSLHDRYGIIHKDLKASNVLVTCPARTYILDEDVRYGNNPVVVADFECSEIGVVGTRFWRAPEILLQLKNRESPIQFTKHCDIYSFAMLAYELVTGSIPFEDLDSSNYDVVLSGGRPELPEDLDFSLKHIITECWHPEPLERPDFRDLENRLLGSSPDMRERHVGPSSYMRVRVTLTVLVRVRVTPAKEGTAYGSAHRNPPSHAAGSQF